MNVFFVKSKLKILQKYKYSLIYYIEIVYFQLEFKLKRIYIYKIYNKKKYLKFKISVYLYFIYGICSRFI